MREKYSWKLPKEKEKIIVSYYSEEIGDMVDVTVY
jgi:hypothetical protein